MCGIAGIILKQRSQLNVVDTVLKMSAAIKHRGPDGEGLVTFTKTSSKPLLTRDSPRFKTQTLSYIPKESAQHSDETIFAALTHRRLAIIDLSDAGHQPMCNKTEDVWITFNGEIYNYKELRTELTALGHPFVSETDTEVVINSYKQWGIKCVEHFNGMWAFCLYDKVKDRFFCSRDRLGVKPFYYINDPVYFAFASEQKAFIESALIKARFNTRSVHNYLLNDELENEPANFFEGITELWPGTNLIYNCKEDHIHVESYFNIEDHVTNNNEHLSDQELAGLIKEKLFNAVNLRLRSDVEVGTCLSGGIDSSSIAGIMAQNSKQPIHCFTSVFKSGAVNEEYFADLVSAGLKAKHFKTEPTVTEFENDFEKLVYALDAPIWDSSTYAQFRVMRLAKEQNIKVVLDGQGADELFAGYHHHFMAQWNQTIKEDGVFAGLAEIKSSSISISNPFMFYFKQKIKQNLPGISQNHFSLLDTDFVNSHTLRNDGYFNNVNQQLIDDMGSKRLKSFLRCEDRCGMWHGVESRTPFSDDIELIELLFSFNGKRKIQKGISKYYLREACKDILPKEVYSRYDKVGFETPMKAWITSLQQTIFEAVEQAHFDFVNIAHLKHHYNSNKPAHVKLLFKLFVLAKWKKVFNG